MNLAYICDCLTVRELVNFENDKVEDLVFAIADPEINGGYQTRRDLESIINFLAKEE